MKIEKLQEKLYSQIPLTKLMELKIDSYSKEELFTSAPLSVNINDKGTGFAGSLLTISTISAWSVVYLLCEELNYKPPIIAIVKNTSTFNTPVTKDIKCISFKPTKKQIEILKEKLERKKSASIKIKSQIIEDGKVCLDFEGLYVIKL